MVVESPVLPEPEGAGERRARKPKVLVLGLLGFVSVDYPVAISTGTFLEFLSRFGIANHAARSTLNRMVDTGLTTRIRIGREAVYGLTARGRSAVAEGEALVWGHRERSWDGTWTLVTFSLPESRRDARHRLRSRLIWHGFGSLRSGVWVAPGEVDIVQDLCSLGVGDDVRIFSGGREITASTESLIAEAYDIPQIASAYVRFIQRWDGDDITSSIEALPALFLMRGEWQQLVQLDPGLPGDLAPPDWRAAEAEGVFRRRYAELELPAREELRRFASVHPVSQPN